MTEPRERPLFIWDGDCGFCRYWMIRWRARVGEAVDFAPYQEVEDRFPGFDREDFQESSKLVTRDGEVLEGAAAAWRLMAYDPGWRLPWRLYRLFPPARWVSDAGYRAVARNRGLFGRITRAVWGPDPRPSSFRVGGWVLLRGLALVYLIAFVSLAVQVRGLAGPAGILPVGEYLDWIQQTTGGGPAAWHAAPTLAWVADGGLALAAMAWLGAGISLLLLVGVAPTASATLAWALYLSLTVAGQDFMAFQWDALLLETGLAGILLAALPVESPGGADRRTSKSGWRRIFRVRDVPLPVLWIFWWILLRLVLESGLVKLTGGDPVWVNLTALTHHFETQPLPNSVAWFVHHAPGWIHRVGTGLTLAVEIGAPLLLLLPRRIRFAGAAVVIGFQALIFLTGNYTFFNVLTVALALAAFDDAAWRSATVRIPGGRKLLEALRPVDTSAAGAGGGGWVAWRRRARQGATTLLLGLAAAVGSVQVLRAGGVDAKVPVLQTVEAAISPFRTVNGYGLFADMTTERPEIILEGRTEDGRWKELEFAYKPDDPSEGPPQVAPHQPRLDWQMWFAALRAERSSPSRPSYDRWFIGFVEAILAGSETVTGLLAEDSPFTDRPPAALRAAVYQYRFASPDEREATGDWWTRRRSGIYLPAVRSGPTGLQRVEDVADGGSRRRQLTASFRLTHPTASPASSRSSSRVAR